MAEGAVTAAELENAVPLRSKGRVLAELLIAYGLILLVIWTPRPLQRTLWWVAAAAVVVITGISFDGLDAMGLRTKNFFRSLWVVGVALLVSAVTVAVSAALHTLHAPGSPIAFIATFAGYAIWTFIQQFLLQCFFLSRLLRLTPDPKLAALMAAFIFAVAHLPNPILTAVTLIWGFAACLLFLRYRNLYPLAMAHAILGITIAIAVPGPVIRNMRVGISYLNYGHQHKPTPSLKP
jgi:membrane protease YdiL (CAAX protease family)